MLARMSDWKTHMCPAEKKNLSGWKQTQPVKLKNTHTYVRLKTNTCQTEKRTYESGLKMNIHVLLKNAQTCQAEK